MDKSTAAKPQLNKAWWDKNKAKTLTSTGVGKSLQGFELALHKALNGTKPAEDEAVVQKAIVEAGKTMAAARSKANKTLHADTIVALTNMEKLLQEEGKKSVARSKQLPKVAPQKSGKAVVVWERDIAAEVLKKVKPAWLKDFKGYKLGLTLDNSILDVLEAEGDYTTPAFMVEDAQKIGERVVAQIVKFIGQIDAATAGKPPSFVDSHRAKLEPAVKSVLADAAKELEKVPQARWDKFVARNQQYKDYKVKAGLNVTLGVLGVAGSAVGIVGSGGAGLAIGIVTLVRSSAALVKQVYDLAIDADKVGKDLTADLTTLFKAYKDAEGKVRQANQAAREISGTVLKSVLGTDIPFYATLPKATANYDLWDNKIAGVTVAGREASKAITEALKQTATLEAKIKNAQDKEAQAVYAKLVKMQKSLDASLTKTSDLMAKVRRFEENGPGLKALLDELNTNNSDFAKIFDKTFPTAVNLALSGANASQGFKSASDALETANAALGLSADIMSAGKDQLEAWLG